MINVVSREVFMPSPAPGAGVHAQTYYLARQGGAMMSLHTIETRSDTLEVAYRRYSEDHGRTWSAPEEWAMRFDDPRGTGRRHPRGVYVDPATGRQVCFWTEGVLPGDHPLEGMRQWVLHHSVAEEGARVPYAQGQIIHEGAGYDAVHHMPGITVGRNCLMMGDHGERPLTRHDGVILLPVQSSPVGPDGAYANPGAGLTYTDCLLLLGKWRPDGTLAWTASDRVAGDPQRTTRGMIEPTIAELDDGRILMVMRGSNDVRPEWPGHRWCAFSADGGLTWSRPEPWRFQGGEAFFSPSSCSQLIPLADGRLFWMGNISPENPRGNAPRYPLVLGEVDRKTGWLIKETLTVIDDRQPGDSPHLTLSNFFVREDRASGGLALHLTRLFARDFRLERRPDFTADALLYRIDVSV